MMKLTPFTLLLACAFLLLIAASTAVAAPEKDGEVVVLTDDNFNAEIAKMDLALVEFYAPWCGHCKSLEPKYAAAAVKLAADAELSKTTFLVKFDADANKQVAGKHGVSGFPTIKLFRNGEFAEDFEGDRTEEGILAYLKKKAAVVVNKEITSLSALKTLTKAKSMTTTTIVGFFASKNSVDYKYFAAVVAQFANAGIDVYHTADPDVLEGFGFYGGGSSIQIYRPDAKPFKVVYRGTIFKQQLKEWVLEHAVPAVGSYTPETEKIYAMVGSPIIRFISGPEDHVNKKFLASLAKEHPSLKFTTSAAADYQSDVDAHCEKGAKVCVLAMEGTKSRGNRVFGMSATFSEDATKEFISDFLAKKLTVKVKSEAAAPAPVAGEVAVVVGTTFEKIVGDATKDVFIEFYAPWCGHCKALAPKFDELAKELSGEFENVVVAKMDMTANDLPAEYKNSYEVSGFPTLYFAPKGKKLAPVKFDGAREVADMKKWVMDKKSA